MNKFDNFLGPEKATAFNNVLESFENFLLTNFRQEQSEHDKIKAFLEYIAENNGPDSSWIYETNENRNIYDLLESSGMRVEIICNGWEFDDYFDSFLNSLPDIENIDSIELIEEIVLEDENLYSEEEQKAWRRRDSLNEIRIQNMYRINSFGKYIRGIELIAKDNPQILEYIGAVRTGSKIRELDHLAESFLENVENFDTPIMKRIIMVELYLDLMNKDLNEQRHANNGQNA